MPDPKSFFIATPSFNGLTWLPACVASVARQAAPNLRVHHHVQDGGSTDGTADWLAEYATRPDRPATYSFSWASEKDAGMYDAINCAWDRADASWGWIGQLNSDEQYLPGALSLVADAGVAHPRRGAIAGDCVWVDEDGGYICSRKPAVGWWWVGRVWIPAPTCALFIRRSLFGGERGLRFDTTWKSFGDKVLCRDLLAAGCRFGYLARYLSVFIHRGDNLGFQPISVAERARYERDCLSPWARRIKPLSILAARASLAWRESLGRRCRDYIFIDPDGAERTVKVPRHRWSPPR